jgi:hypothetical protein
MKAVILIMISILLFNGCSVNDHTASDGTNFMIIKTKWEEDFTKCSMNKEWYEQVRFNIPPMSAIADCYQTKQAYQLCNDWDYAYQEYYWNEEFVKLLRDSISEALLRQNQNPLVCRNPGNDALIKAKIDVSIANQKAANANARANAAERAAKKKEQCLRAAEAGKVKAWSC